MNFSTNCINSQTFINYLNTRAVYVSGGSACDKGEPSHTLQAMGCADLTVRTALRVSFCADNTAEDVDALLDGVNRRAGCPHPAADSRGEACLALRLPVTVRLP